MDILTVPQGKFELARYPVRKKSTLRAWDAADEYLLKHLSDEFLNNKEETKTKILIVNDSFGALSLSLSEYAVTIWTDSWLTEKALQYNCIQNNIAVNSIKIVSSIETPSGDYDLVLIKVPKSLAMLEDQLLRIKSFISPAVKMISSGMVKSIHTSTLKLFEKSIGKTTTSLAKKKARLIFSDVDSHIPYKPSPYPKKYILENTDYELINHANVFSRERLDVGTRFFIQHIPQSEKYKSIIDLACGNGVVGLIASIKNPDADVLFLDESYMAVESARENILLNSKNISAKFEVTDCLTGIKKESADLILNNPPFHQNTVVGDEVAWQMFKQSKSVLKEKGELWVIGNRHLGYHAKLQRIFNNCEVVATNKKFVILKAIK